MGDSEHSQGAPLSPTKDRDKQTPALLSHPLLWEGSSPWQAQGGSRAHSTWESRRRQSRSLGKCKVMKG